MNRTQPLCVTLPSINYHLKSTNRRIAIDHRHHCATVALTLCAAVALCRRRTTTSPSSCFRRGSTSTHLQDCF
ncbi:hypothetical protein L6452_07459 [Arctium lappa]|uniref:Uncharacterized protein n=1 Tax=Arctium lappa TaxID=4217 RepID=A0ACB9EL41_ARCLA|nr:hypothetical protein L6452_07459 [Arctium lappa]